MKKIIFSSLLCLSVLSSNAFADYSTTPYYVESCSQLTTGLMGCQMGTSKPADSTYTQPALNMPTMNMGTAATLPNVTQPSGSYNSKVSNIFAFCSGGRPGRHDPMRAIYDQVCPSGQSNGPSLPGN